MCVFPDCFPDNLASEILPVGAKNECLHVYRVIKYGRIDRQGFISTYEEMQAGLIPLKKRMNLNDPGLYSTSCNIDRSEAEYVLNIFMKHYPKPFIARGQTHASCGPCQLTSERESRQDTHVDWWIYRDAKPQNYFDECE